MSHILDLAASRPLSNFEMIVAVVSVLALVALLVLAVAIATMPDWCIQRVAAWWWEFMDCF